MATHKDKIEKEEEQDDVEIVEEFDSAVSGLQSKSRHVLKGELKKCQKERQEYLEGWQRAKADLVNQKKIAEEERKKYATFASEDLITQLLPVLDSFEMAFRDTEAWEKADENWRKGVEYIYAQLMSVLEVNGVKVVNPLGEAFDPNAHESIETVAVESKEKDHTVVFVVQSGYLLGERLVRPARVHVGAYTK